MKECTGKGEYVDVNGGVHGEAVHSLSEKNTHNDLLKMNWNQGINIPTKGVGIIACDLNMRLNKADEIDNGVVSVNRYSFDDPKSTNEDVNIDVNNYGNYKYIYSKYIKDRQSNITSDNVGDICKDNATKCKDTEIDSHAQINNTIFDGGNVATVKNQITESSCKGYAYFAQVNHQRMK